MAAGAILIDSQGRIIVNAEGKMMLSDGAGDDCCCGPTATPCIQCATTPFSITMAITKTGGASACCDGIVGTYDIEQNTLDVCSWGGFFDSNYNCDDGTDDLAIGISIDFTSYTVGVSHVSTGHGLGAGSVQISPTPGSPLPCVGTFTGTITTGRNGGCTYSVTLTAA